MTRQKQKAFTFIESIVVILIIILLASIVIPGLLRDESVEDEAPLELNLSGTAAE